MIKYWISEGDIIAVSWSWGKREEIVMGKLLHMGQTKSDLWYIENTKTGQIIGFNTGASNFVSMTLVEKGG